MMQKGKKMGNGYWILIWDDFGCGLDLINPRLFTVGDSNWFPCDRGTTEADVQHKHNLPEHFRIIFS
jgi:hypothetical protein